MSVLFVLVVSALLAIEASSAHAQGGPAPAAPAPVAPDSAPVEAPSAPVEAPSPPAAAAPSSPPAALEPVGEVVEITSEYQTDAQRLQRSADAVNVIDTHLAQQQSADLGEVLARSQGIVVRRGAGLGSTEQLSLDGLSNEQIRFFLDGVPLELAGFPFGVANVPVNLIDRVEVYRGVVPIRFGADALGGAINLVRVPTDRTRLGASYQVGSFGTHRLTLDGAYRDAARGWTAGGSAFLDLAKNDYAVDARVADELGQLTTAKVDRFHDGYRAGGGTLEVALHDRPWARRLTLQAAFSSFEKDLQSNVIMAVPYGEVTYRERVLGTTARYEVGLAAKLDLELVANYAHRRIQLTDLSPWVYDWFGKRIYMRTSSAGEIDATPTDQVVWENSGFARATLKWAATAHDALRLSVSPTVSSRTGNERVASDPALRDPLSARRRLSTLVAGVEHERDWLAGRLVNVAFAKGYVYRAATEEVIAGGALVARDRALDTFGAGDALRVRLVPWLFVKASYEYATRMPRTDEVFGDGVLVRANLGLAPEVSHNANFGPRVERKRTAIGDLTYDANAFLRDSNKLIVLFGNDREFSYQNVFRARGLGLEQAVAWTAPGRWVGLDGTLTYEDVRVVSDDGAFADFDGDRLPNRPYLFGSWGAHLHFEDWPGAGDVIEPFSTGRYSHAFYRSWESQGMLDSKQQIAAQLTHNLGVTWSSTRGSVRLTTTLEIDNLTDAKVYDSFGAQRPGRAVYLKLTGEL